MGYDCITYEGHIEQFDDFELWTVRHFLIEQARAMEATLPGTEATALRAFVEKWDWIGPGVIIGTNLSDYILKCPTRWELFRQLLQHAGDRIAGFGEFVPLDYLALHVNTPTAYFTKAQPTRRFLNCIRRMCVLLTRHEPQAP